MPSDNSPGDNFGATVSISDDYAIVGANDDDDNGKDTGSAYIFKRDGNTWIEQMKLLASDGTNNDYFGWAVSISGDYAIVGGLNLDSAYIFKRDGETWIEQSKLLASDGADYDQFGWAVSIFGDYAIVGAHGNDDNGSRSGSAYIFKREGESYVEQTKLLPSDGAEGDCFGFSVSISGQYAIVGAPRDYQSDSNGYSYIFKKEGDIWLEQAKLLPSDGTEWDCFGESVSISRDYAIVGARGDDDKGEGSGSAYIFKRDGENWIEQVKLLDSGSIDRVYCYFGASVSILGDYAIVGAWQNDGDGNVKNSGAAYIFKREGNTWTEKKKLLASDGSNGDNFGYSVFISGDHAIVGARNDYDSGGSAYIYTIEKSDILIPGDANCNGIVEIKDLLSSQQVLIGDTPSPFNFKAVDFDANGKLDVGDQVKLLMMISEKK